MNITIRVTVSADEINKFRNSITEEEIKEIIIERIWENKHEYLSYEDIKCEILEE